LSEAIKKPLGCESAILNLARKSLMSLHSPTEDENSPYEFVLFVALLVKIPFLFEIGFRGARVI
jgi:hypothetical protein